MVAGCIDFPAIPEHLERPYLKRNAPLADGAANMGLPPTTSDINSPADFASFSVPPLLPFLISLTRDCINALQKTSLAFNKQRP